MSDIYSLTVAGFDSIQKGIHHATVFENKVNLQFLKNGSPIKQVSLAADRVSLSQTYENTVAKIHLICGRLGVEEKELAYDRSSLSKLSKIFYKLLFLKKIAIEALIPVQWVIVYKNKNETKWRKIIPDSKVFQADPFLVYKDDKYYVFYEELKFDDYHGYLRVAELDVANGKLLNDQIILKLDNHLSFPNVFEENGCYYMIPECADSNAIDLYECTEFPYVWQKKQTLIDNIHAVDTTPLKTQEGWYLFTTEIVKGAECNDELSIYKSANIFNQPFEKLYDQPVISDVTNARMAGHFIQRGADFYRVSQNCGKRYGHQTNINKVLQIEGGYQEETIEVIKPSFGALGFHTYNEVNDLVIGDMELMRFDLYSLKRFMMANIQRLKKIIS